MRGRGIRVLHCIPSIWSGSGGPSRAVLEMCRAAKEANAANQTDIATTDYGLTAPWLDYVRSRIPEDTSLRIFRRSRWLDKGWSISLIAWLWRVAREYDVIHIHALFSSTSAMCAWVARRQNVPYVIRPLGTLSPYTFANRKKYLKRFYFRLIDKKTVLRAAAIHYTTSQEAKKADRLNLPTRKAVIPLPYGQITPYQRSESPADTVLFLSRLHPVKGIELLIEAMVSVRAVVSSARLVMAGSGDVRYELLLRETAASMNMASSVSFIGFVEGAAKTDLLNRASVFVLPSYQENFGLAVVEALAHGLPVVITRSVDLFEDVENYRSGYVVGHDAKELAAALLALLGDREKRTIMGANGRRQVKDLYSASRVGAQLDSLYRSVSGVPGGA